jgi:hypothetical protein
MRLDQVCHFLPLRNSSLTLVTGSRVDYHPASDPRTESSRRSSYYSGCKSELENLLSLSLSLSLYTSSGRSELPSWVCFFGFGGHWNSISFYEIENRRLHWKSGEPLTNENLFLAPTSYRPQRQGPSGGYYGRNSSYGFRPENFSEYGQGPNQYQGNRSMRNGSYGSHSGYGMNGEYNSPTHSHQLSYETMTSGSEENTKTTNPSSINSSSDHIQPYRKQGENGYDGSQITSYGSNATSSTITQYGCPPFLQNWNENENALMLNFNALPNRYAGMQNGNGPISPPPANNPHVPIKLNNSPQTTERVAAETPTLSAPKEKRKSWIKRRFSKRES